MNPRRSCERLARIAVFERAANPAVRASSFAWILGLIAFSISAFLTARAGETLRLAGSWRLRLDPDDQGLAAAWFHAPLDTPAKIHLPTTTDLAGFGFPLDLASMQYPTNFPITTRFPGVKEPTRADEHGYLVRRQLFVGPAWYERDVVIPPSWRDHTVVLRLERALWQTDAWIDGRPAGTADSLVAEHRHDLGRLAPGPHRLTVRVDNRMIHNLSTITHAYGPETQSCWNGLLGRLVLEAYAPVALEHVEVFPAADRRSVKARIRVRNSQPEAAPLPLTLRVLPDGNGRALATVRASPLCPPGLSEHDLALAWPDPATAWDEFQPQLHRVRVSMDSTADSREALEIHFGFRHIERHERELRLNGRALFLRGTLDCAVYPRTGHPPMTLAEWERVFATVKEYGFNHVRFHTWCPPDAAFEAADRLGLYLQAEAPAWVDDWGTETVTRPAGLGRDPDVATFIRAELRRMSEAYGNHPSFLLCAAGNEFGEQHTDWDQVNGWITEIQALDPRRLYTGCGARRHLPADQFWFTHHTGTSTRGVGPPHTDWDFRSAVEASPVPVLSHETGQRPVFPDYPRLLPKFTGPLLPLNLARRQRDLVTNGLAAEVDAFVRASARFQAVQYKAEHEAMRRTPGLAGYQLLMLNDFTGQSEALVGILDPFGESKGVVRPAEIRAWNAPTVLLARFAKYTWTPAETLRVRVDLSHFGPDPLPAGRVVWTLAERRGKIVKRGAFPVAAVTPGQLSALGEFVVDFTGLPTPAEFALTVRLGEVENRWNLWLYPDATAEAPAVPTNVLVSKTFDAPTRAHLEAGGRVVLLAHGHQGPQAARTGFESVYWSAGWWGNRFSSLGIVCDPRHPALADFPTEPWCDWQWRELRADATTFDLTDAPPGLRGIVQPVPDFHFNHRLAQVFEVRVGRGAMLVCGFDLSSRLDSRPVARQLRESLRRYVAGPDFHPAITVPTDWLRSRVPGD